MDEHLEDDAELYALGLLDDAERERVDAHVEVCDACAARLGRAERAVAALVDAVERRPVRRAQRWPAAIAAAFALACAGLGAHDLRLQAAVAADGRAFDALVGSHFAHAQFQSSPGVPIAAKVIYDLHGRWYQIVATGLPAWQVRAIASDGTERAIAARPERRGATAILFLDAQPGLRTLEIDDARGAPLGSVRPFLAREQE